MAARSRPIDELELRRQLAERDDDARNRQARALCAVSSPACRAGAPEEWLDYQETHLTTFCFCAAHSLAARVLIDVLGEQWDGVSGRQIITQIKKAELP